MEVGVEAEVRKRGGEEDVGVEVGVAVIGTTAGVLAAGVLTAATLGVAVGATSLVIDVAIVVLALGLGLGLNIVAAVTAVAAAATATEVVRGIEEVKKRGSLAAASADERAVEAH